MTVGLPTWREAWEAALYGPGGFFRRSSPVDHFRTSVHASSLFAEALLRLARRHDLDHVVDVGAGGGELLRHLHAADASLELTGVDLADRPDGLPARVRWSDGVPDGVVGLVVANEWLDNVPCDVVEVDEANVPRIVHVDPRTGDERLGEPVTDPWLDRWWPLAEPGTRAEIGRARDEAWADVVRRLDRGVAVAMDYGHVLGSRPPFGSLASYQRGRQVSVVPDGTRDITAHVAVDSLVQDRRSTQREVLLELGIDASRPSVDLARSDPTDYLRALSRASEAAELTAGGGLGDLTWVMVVRERACELII